MDWKPLTTIVTDANYLFTPAITSSLFRLKHISSSLIKNSLKIVIRQAFEDDNGTVALFDYKLISCKAEQEIILLSQPPGLTGRKIAVKRVDNLLDEKWEIEIQSLDFIENGVNMPINISNVVDLQQRLDSIQSELTLKALDLDLDNHALSTNNPHSVTAIQVGADIAGSAISRVFEHEGTTNHPLVSPSTQGMMAAADKSKLEAIEPGATANSTDAYLTSRTNHTGTQSVLSIDGLVATLSNFVDLSTNQNIAGDKFFTRSIRIVGSISCNELINGKGYQYDGTPLNIAIERPVSANIHDFIEIGKFQIDNGGIVFRLSLIVSDPGFSLAKTYVASSVYNGGDSGWKRLIPEKSSVYAAYNDCEVDIRLINDTTYLRLRRSGIYSVGDVGVGQLRLEFLGSSRDSTFTQTYLTGTDPSVTGSY